MGLEFLHGLRDVNCCTSLAFLLEICIHHLYFLILKLLDAIFSFALVHSLSICVSSDLVEVW